MKMNRIRYISPVVAFTLALVLHSCIGENVSIGDSGQTLVKILPAGFTVVNLNPVSTSQTVVMFDIRRKPGGPDAFSRVTTATIEFDNDTSLLNQYNSDNGTSFIPLPSELYTTTPVTRNGRMIAEIKPGEFAATVSITVPNALNLDFSAQYALVYKLTEVTDEGTISRAADSVAIVQVLARNKYDGIYTVTARSPMKDVVNPAFTGYYPFRYVLETTGEHTCDVYEFDNMTPLHPILSATGAWSYYGGFCPTVTFSPSGDGTIVSVDNYFGHDYGSNKRDCVIDPTGINKWDAVKKTISIRYIMIQKANTPLTTPWHRTFFDEVWTYSGPR